MALRIFHHDCTDTSDPCPMQPEPIGEFECALGWYWEQYAPDREPNLVGPFPTAIDALNNSQRISPGVPGYTRETTP